MNQSKNLVEKIYDKMASWLTDINSHELTNIIDLVDKAKQFAVAAESLPEDKVKQFIDNFRYDLKEFYQMNKQQAQSSLYLSVLNETLWQLLAQMTDQSQVEWAELIDDFEHNGDYTVGDIVGFGELTCNNCQQSILISHVSTVNECLQCGEKSFTRHAYSSG